ncbi:MAG: lectin-like protein [Polyangiaceae bacterium]
MRVLLANTRLTAGALLLFGLAACGSAHNADLFRSSGSPDENGGAGNASSGGAPPEAGGSCNCTGPVAGTSTGSAGNSGGESSIPPNGGAAGDVNSGGASGGSIFAGSGGDNPSECDQYSPDASYFSETQHCYLVVHELATFAEAQKNCQSLGAHLVTFANSAENDFAWNLNNEEHWIGSTDGKGPNSPIGGTFAWVTGEPFTYTNWSPGQPNISDTDCGDSGLSGHCYEHCVFQWTGGAKDGEWNDRFCLHTIAAICEWEGER